MVESLKWINDIVKLHYIKLVPSEEFVDDNDDNNLRYWKETGKRVLTKNIKNNLIFDNELEKKFLIELKLHLRRDFNERIIQIFGISQNPITNSFIFVIQYADGGNLRHVLENTNPSWIDKFSLAHQISDGLNFLHSKGLIHGNLYPRNIVFHQNRAKLTNFGILEHLITNFSTSSSYDELSIKNIPYVDPQLLLDETYKKDTRSDIYSFGVIMWEISSGFPPYKSVLQKNDLISNILKNKREIIIPNTPKVYSDLYTECWNNDPNKRLDINVLINQLNNSLNYMKSDLKSSGQISEQDKELKELEIDALAAELWLDMGEKKEVIPEIKVKEDINVESSSEIITEIPFENKEVKSREVRIITNESELSRKLSNKKKSWTSKAKSKAKGFVKRFSGSTSGSEMNTSNIRKSSTKSMSMDSKEIIGQREQLETGWTLVSSDIKEPESPMIAKSESIISRGLFNFSNVTGRSASESSISKSLLPDKFPYSEYCKTLFATKKWTLNSAPCYAAYHVRCGDVDGLKWHIHVQKEDANKLQQVTGPRNSYRRPLEPLMIEAAQCCPGENIIKTFTSLQSLGATCDVTNSYTGGSPINYLGENKSLFSSESNSQNFKDSLTYLITNECSINTRKQNGDTLLITILFKWYKELTPNVIKFCLDYGSNPDLNNEIGGTPLGYTLTQIRFSYDGGPFEKIYKILKLLVKYGADVNKQITIPGKKLPNLLFVCVDMGMNMREENIKKLIKRLIKWGVNVNARMGEQEKDEEEENFNNDDDDDDDIIMLAGTSKSGTTPKVTFNLTDDQKEKDLSTTAETLNVLGYAAKLSQLITIKILLDRIYSLSSPESIKEALNVTSKEEIEQKKYLKSWLNDSGKEKRDKVKIKMERREMKRREKLKRKVKKGKQTENYDDDEYNDNDGDDDGEE